MTETDIHHDDVEEAAASLQALQRRHGPSRAVEIAAARIRAEADYLARWTGPSPAARRLAEEAHRLVAEAAADMAVPPAVGVGTDRRPLPARAAGWGVAMLVLVGLGVSGWALG